MYINKYMYIHIYPLSCTVIISRDFQFTPN